MRYAVIARAPRVGSVLEQVDDARARAVPGVLDVVRIPTGVAVIATRTWAAMRGRDALTLRWSNVDAGGSSDWMHALEQSIEQGKRARHEGGDTDAMLAVCARQLTQTYHAPFQAHAMMEPLNCTVELRDGQCTLWVGTQAPNQVQTGVATQLGIPPERVTVHVPLLGGGFGRRLDVDYVREAVEVARAGTSPVQVVWTREDDLRHDMYQPAQVNRLSAGVDAAGLPTVWRHRVADFNLTMFGEYSADYNPAADGDPWGGFDTPYAFQSLDVTLALLKSPVPTGAWRAVSYPAAVFARESFLDEIAHDTGRDPLALRLALLPSPGNVRAGQRELPNGDRLRRVLQLAADRAGWSRPFARERAGRRWGRGIACNGYHQRTMVAQVAEVSVGRAGDVRVHRVVCAVDCGQVINRLGLEGQFESGVLWALSAALKGQVTFTNGRADQGNFDTFPVMRMHEAPLVEVHVVDSDLPPFGVGEQPVPPVAPAVFNAVFAATGHRVRRTPLRAEDLRAEATPSSPPPRE
jgi:isoquinoline 1-oxidoreductase beta subunit